MPDSSFPLPLKQIFDRPRPSRHPQIESVTLSAGSVCRQGALDAMPSISTTPTHSALQIANSIHAAFHVQSHFRSSILRLSTV